MRVQKITTMPRYQISDAAKGLSRIAAGYVLGAVAWHVSLRVLDFGLTKLNDL